MTIYCKNQNCQLENRICCNKCSQQYHKHEITDINDLKIDIDNAASKLASLIDEIQVKIEQITSQANSLIKKIKIDLDELLDVSGNFQNQTKTQLLKGITKSNESRIQKIISSCSLKQHIPDKKIENPPPINNYLQNLILNYQNLRQGEYIDEALECLEEILQIDPFNTQFKKEKCNILSNVAQLIEQQLKNEVNQAHGLFEQGQYQEAFDIYSEAVNQNIHDFKVYYQTGVCLTKLNQYQESIKYFEMSLLIDESNHDALYDLSQSLYIVQDAENLRLCHENMKHHQHPKEQYVEGQIYLLTSHFDKAVKIFEGLVKKNDLDNFAQFLKAQALIQSGGINFVLGLPIIALLEERHYDQEKIKYLENLQCQSSQYGRKQ